MRSKLWLVGAVGVLLVGCTQEKMNSPLNDESAVRNQTAAYQEAFNKHEADKVASLWTENAVYFNPITGEKAEGRAAIAAMYKKKFDTQKARSVDIIVKSIEFPESDESIERGVVRISFDEKPVRQFAYESRYVKQSNQWLLQQIKEIELLEAPTSFEHLKALEWLTGHWVDSDENVSITFISNWDQHKNFLTQHFNMQVLGQSGLEGQQVIAWDPINNNVRSWVFDSDGGFGEGKWTKKGNSWYARMKFTLSDGRKAIATNVYTKLDENNYTFASVGREMDGEILPNIDPVKVTRIK